MKKKIIIMLLTVLTLILLSVTAFAYTIGDINGDSKLNAADARLTLRYSAKIEQLSEEQIIAADVDKSGTVNASDARKILRVAAKVDPPFEGLNIDEYLIEKGVLNVAVPKDNEPFAYEENGELKGIDVSTMERFAKNLNLELKLHPMSYDECLDAVKNGTCDMATSYDNSGNHDGFAKPQSYYYISLSAVVLKSSSFNSVDQIKNDASLKIGVLDNSIDKIIVEKTTDKSKISAFATCKDAVAALANGSIDVFITNTEYAFTTSVHNGNIKVVIDPADYYVYNHSAVVAENKAEMLEIAGPYITVDGIRDYHTINDTTKLSVSQNNITLAPGGSACIEVFADSFYTSDAHVYVPNDGTSTTQKFVEINGKIYMFISTYDTLSRSGPVTISCTSGIKNVECKVNVTIDTNGPKYYQYFDGRKIPDFGAFTGTSPEQTEIDIENKVVVHTYSAADLYYNGITEASQIEAYLDSLEAAGYAYMGYQELANTVSLIFGNEKTEEIITYVEAYDEEGYLAAIGVGYMLPDYMF